MQQAYYEILRNLIFRGIVKETRLSERQVAQLQWEQVESDTIRTRYGREVQLSRELYAALSLMPKDSPAGFVFSGSALLKPSDDYEALREDMRRKTKGSMFRKLHLKR